MLGTFIFFFPPLPPDPQSNLPRRRTVSERHPNPSTYLHWLFLTTSSFCLPVLRAVSQAKKKTKLDKIAMWQAGTYKYGVPLSVTRFVLAPQRALRPCSSSGKEPVGSTQVLPFQLTSFLRPRHLPPTFFLFLQVAMLLAQKQHTVSMFSLRTFLVSSHF